MNNNTKKRFNQTTRKTRSEAFKDSNKRNDWNKKGKVAANPRVKSSNGVE